MIEYISEHWVEFSALGAAAITAIGIIVKLTPSEEDDKVWAKFLKLIGKGTKK